MESRHYAEDRRDREALIQSIGEGEPYIAVKLDRGHKNGAEIHVLTTTGIIRVYNARTGVLCTKMLADPDQVRRYINEVGALAVKRYNTSKAMDAKLIATAYRYISKGYNHIKH